MRERRTLVVTGSSSGIGRAISEMLLSEGHQVIGVSRKPDAFPQNDSYIPIACDLSRLDEIKEKLKDVAQSFPRIDGLISNAGAPRFGFLEQLSFDQIRQGIEMNLLSHIGVTRALIPTIKKQNRGDLILMGSESALRGAEQGSIYCASKFGLRGFAQALRRECSSTEVRVTLINPGMVRTSFFDEASFEPGPADDNAIEPRDVAEAVRLALSARVGTTFDEINLSPQKKVVFKKKNQQDNKDS